MPTTKYNFYYDPVYQGFDATVWRTLFGTPALDGNYLNIPTVSYIVHFAQLMRGEYTFNMKLSAPDFSDYKEWGLIQINRGSFIRFRIDHGQLYASMQSDGLYFQHVPITWQSGWTNVDTEFTIRWEPGFVSFFVNGSLEAQIGNDYVNGLPVSRVPGKPLSLYITNQSTDSDPCFLKYIEAQGIQSYIETQGTGNPIDFGDSVFTLDGVEITESVSVTNPVLSEPSSHEEVAITELVTVKNVDVPSGITDTFTISENVSILIPVLPTNVHDNAQTTENINPEKVFNLNIVSNIQTTESKTLNRF